jgi:hypothetical protein
MSTKERSAPRATAGRPTHRDNAQRKVAKSQAKRKSFAEFNADAIGRASAADAAWFEAHPMRSHRLRPAIVDEMPGIGVEDV